MNHVSKSIFLPIMMMTIVMSCRNSVKQVSLHERAKIEDAETSFVVLMPDSTEKTYEGLRRVGLVARFYAQRDNTPLWLDDKRILPIGDTLIAYIKRARYYGLFPSTYHIREIEVKKNNLHVLDNVIRLDALLTDAFFSFAKDLHYGQLKEPPQLKSDSAAIQLLQGINSADDLCKILISQEPDFSGYRSLKHVLKCLLDTLSFSDKEAIMEEYTSDSLNLHKTVQNIEINLERWRWENSALGERYVFINIPSFMLQVFSGDDIVFSSKVVVGKPETQTPVLSSQIECFTIYPYWHVPRKIAVEEFLPVIQRDIAFIHRNNFDVLDRDGTVLNPDSVDWQKFNKNYFPVRLRQREGVENSLGILKFIFDNPYAVFLHDTNAKKLFKNSVRAFSHGCIRMEKAVELAYYVTTGDPEMQSPVVDRYINEKKRFTVTLKKPIPIHVRYFTCEVRNNVFYSYQDIYKQDEVIMDLLYNKKKSILSSRR